MIVIFAGPSLRVSDRARLDAAYRPPASQGDVYRAVKDGATVIGVIDGFFDNVASVWHKEVLFALQSGVHVFGAASMGALRAAETHQFGMVGIGKIFQAYRDGELEDDDEVAVFHGDAESGFVPLSDAMVDIREIVREAQRQGILTAAGAAQVIQDAKSLHYRERRLNDVVAAAAMEQAERDGFAQWLRQNHQSQKRLDAIALLDHIATHAQQLQQPFIPDFHFERTIMWYEFQSFLGEVTRADESDAALTLEDILDEVRLDGFHQEILDAALNRFMLVREHDKSGLTVDRTSVERALERFRRERDLLSSEEFQAWRVDNGLADRGDITRFFNDQARVYHAGDRMAPSAQRFLIDALRARGVYGEFAGRAKAKRDLVGELRVLRSAEEMQAATQAAIAWFEERGQSSRDFRKFGFPDYESFVAAIWKEYEFVRRSEPQVSTA